MSSSPLEVLKLFRNGKDLALLAVINVLDVFCQGLKQIVTVHQMQGESSTKIYDSSPLPLR